ncbi:MAG: elongation factor Ts [Ruminococcaceae bacterium]|nr:elongation factor Ts [Oscillospiraceae bacterium]
MAQITAKDVAALRAKTGLGMMDCKKALVEADGDVDAAVKILREKGLATAAKKESRIAAEGVVDIMVDGKNAAMIEVNAETDFVAKNATFQEFVKGLLRTLLANKPADLTAFGACKFDGSDITVSDALVEKIAMIGEKISIRRFVLTEGVMSTYIHGAGNTGVIVVFDTDDATAAKSEFAVCAKDVALQIAAGNPPTYVAKADVPQSAIDEEVAIQVAAAKNDPKLASKPDAVLAKIVEGKLGKLFFEKVCLLEQPFVKDDSMSVGKYVAACAKTLGAEIAVKAFYIFEKGEGIEKREDDFAAEIEKMVKG